MKAGIYARESCSDTNKAPSIQEQIKRGLEWIEKNGHQLTEVYQDNGFSGADWNRPAWIQALNDAKRHQYQILWTWNQDRLARDVEQFLFFYRNISGAKVRIYEDTSNSFIDMSDLGGKLKHQSLAQAAEVFRLITSEKVKKAYASKKEKGERWGRLPKKFDRELAIKLRSEGKGWREIGKACGVSYQTARRYIIGLHSNKDKSNVIPIQNDKDY